MTNKLLLSALLLLTSFGLICCQSSNQSNKDDSVVKEMPRPVADMNLDSLKQIQQQKRDSLRRSK